MVLVQNQSDFSNETTITNILCTVNSEYFRVPEKLYRVISVFLKHFKDREVQISKIICKFQRMALILTVKNPSLFNFQEYLYCKPHIIRHLKRLNNYSPPFTRLKPTYSFNFLWLIHVATVISHGK